jgi:hypothetical protein
MEKRQKLPFTLNKVRTKVNKPQRETNYQILDKLSYNPKVSQSWKHLEEAPSSSRSTFIINMRKVGI